MGVNGIERECAGVRGSERECAGVNGGASLFVRERSSPLGCGVLRDELVIGDR